MQDEHPDTKRQRKQKQRQEKAVVALFREYLKSCGIRGADVRAHGDNIVTRLNNDGWRRLFDKMDNDKARTFYPDFGNVDFSKEVYLDYKKEVGESCRNGDIGRARFIVKIRHNGSNHAD